MGCGSSKSTATSPASQHKSVIHNGIPEKNHCASKCKPSQANGVTQPSMEDELNNNQISEQDNHNQPFTPSGYTTPTDREIKQHIPHTSQVDSRKFRSHSTLNAVAFEVKFEQNGSLRELRRPPKLQKLDHLPVLTAEMLANKQAIAEENRQKEIEKKLAKTSKRKKQLLEARELDEAQERKVEMETKMNVQSMKRAKLQAQIIEKQRKREMRAQRVREKAQNIREGGDVVKFDMDPDETYNADEEEDTWDIQPTNEQHKNNSDNSISSNSHINNKSNIEDSDDEQPQDPKSVHDFFEE